MTRRRIALVLAVAAAALAPAEAGAATNTLYLTNDTGQDLFLAQGFVQGHFSSGNPPPNAILGSPPGEMAWIEASNSGINAIDMTIVYTLDPQRQASSSNSVTCITSVAVDGVGDSGACTTGSSSALQVIDGPYGHGTHGHWAYTIAMAGSQATDRSPYTMRPATAAGSHTARCGKSGICRVRVRNGNRFPVRVRVADGPAAGRRASSASASTRIAARSSEVLRFRLKPAARRRLVRRGRMERVVHTVTAHPKLRTRRNVRLVLRLRRD